MRKKTIVATLTILLLALIVFAQESQPTITADVPQYSRSTTIDIRGTAPANETIELFIKDIKRRETRTNAQGNFLFQSVHLPETNNDIKLKTNFTEQSYNVTVDLEVPRLRILNFSSLATQPTLSIPIEASKPVTLNYSVKTNDAEPQEQTVTLEQGGKTTLTIQLQEGENEVIITATDKAGHKATYKNTTTLDTVVPQIFETNLAQISPTYIPDVAIKGVLNKKATVFVYVNDAKKPAEYTVSKDDGTFEIPILLKRDIKATTGPKRSSLETGEGWTNKIKLEAVDIAGRKSAPVTADVVYSLCGFGSWFDVKLNQPTPDKLTPRFILEGIQEVGVLFNATYKGTNKIKIGQIVATNAQLSPELDGDYDNGLTDVSLITQASPKSVTGYLQVMFRPFTFSDDKEMTTYDKEKNISMHRASPKGPKGGKGTALTGQYKNCATPGVGCMKLFLEITIPFDEELPKQIVDPRTQKTVPKVQLEKRVQKTCVPLEMMMDIPVPPAKIPKNFLRAAIEFLNRAVDAMDAVLEPLTTVGNYVLYSCWASTAWLYIDEVREAWNCDVQEVLGTVQEFTGQEKAKFEKAVAKAGLCQDAYPGKDKEKARDNCKTCSDSIKNTREFHREVLQPICDRVACPSAPTLQTHIKNAEELEPINEAIPASEEWEKFKIGDKFYAGNDCAFNEYQKEGLRKISLGYQGGQQDISVQGPFSPDRSPSGAKTTVDVKAIGIKDIYEITEKNGKGISQGKITKDDCQKQVRPAHPDCCGFSYKKEWETACGPLPLTDTFEELKESACLAAQNVNKKTTEPGLECGGITNAIAGFCEPDEGGEIVDPIPTGFRYNKKPGTARSDDVYVLLVPKNMFKKKTGQDSQFDYKVYRGFIADRYTKGQTKDQRATYLKEIGGRFEFEVNSKTSEVSDGLELTEHFQKEQSPEQAKAFANKLCDEKITDCNKKEAEELYYQIFERAGASDKYYIVKPDQEGIVRSIQCVCLPAVTSYLQFWRNILGVTRDCFKTILLTGDGSEGICKATLSTYVCDLLFDVVKCFVQKFSTPGAGARPSGGIGGFISTITGAGSNVQQKIQGRYGETALWKTMFVDKKLVHSICAFAFTGTWNFDVSSVFSQTVQSIPVQSQGFLTPCKRQFVSFNPNTNPKGQTTWVYRFGVGLAAGADVRYDLQLKCSQGFRCQEKDGFKNGECDCNKKGEQTRTILIPELQPNPLKKNDILNKEIFYTVQAGDPESAVRYDKAVLKYTYLDQKTNKEQTEEVPCDISLTGGDAPAFCQFDTFSASYRCQFGVGESVIRLDKVEPKYTKQKEGVKMFGLTEPLAVDLHIRQQQPIEKARSFEGAKYIFYTLKDGERIIKKTTEQETFAGDLKLDPKDGTYTHEVRLLENIEKEHFKTTAAREQYKQYLLKGPFNPTKKREDTDIVARFDLSEKALKVPYVLKFDNAGVLDIHTSSSETPNRQGEFTKTKILLADQQIDTNRPATFHITLPAITGTLEKYTITITLTEKPIDTEIIVIPVEKTTKTDPCIDKTPTQWTAQIEIHDADRNGRPAQQISIDPATGDQATKEVMINVVCDDKLEEIAKQKTVTEPAFSDLDKINKEIDDIEKVPEPKRTEYQNQQLTNLKELKEIYLKRQIADVENKISEIEKIPASQRTEKQKESLEANKILKQMYDRELTDLKNPTPPPGSA